MERERGDEDEHERARPAFPRFSGRERRPHLVAAEELARHVRPHVVERRDEDEEDDEADAVACPCGLQVDHVREVPQEPREVADAQHRERDLLEHVLELAAQDRDEEEEERRIDGHHDEEAVPARLGRGVGVRPPRRERDEHDEHVDHDEERLVEPQSDGARVLVDADQREHADEGDPPRAPEQDRDEHEPCERAPAEVAQPDLLHEQRVPSPDEERRDRERGREDAEEAADELHDRNEVRVEGDHVIPSTPWRCDARLRPDARR